MTKLQSVIPEYLSYCKNQKRLDPKTVKAYRIDLSQFIQYCSNDFLSYTNIAVMEEFISNLHQTYKPKTVRRKIATIKAYFHYLEYKDYIDINPFNKLQINFREPNILPKTIPMHVIETLLKSLYYQQKQERTESKKRYITRDIAVIELLFSTGIRISELCSLKISDVDIIEKSILIYGKGSKERQIGRASCRERV